MVVIMDFDNRIALERSITSYTYKLVTLKSLVGVTIKDYYELKDKYGVSFFGTDCALCNCNDSCKTCVIFEKTNNNKCGKTPYEEIVHNIIDKKYFVINQKIIDIVTDELNFLISLRDN